MLAGAINKIREDNATPTKETVAKALGILPKQLHVKYGHLYVTLPGYGKRIDIIRGF